MQGWLPLNEYSIKYRISLSTLRRRIRASEIKFRFDQGKYWLQDVPTAKHLRVQISLSAAQILPEKIDEDQMSSRQTFAQDSQEMLREIKSAFVKVLQEKEEQILLLKEEASDLKTLVKILESENERLKANLGESAPIDYWLQKEI